MTACLLVLAMMCAFIPEALASERAESAAGNGSADISSLYEELPMESGSLTKEVSQDAEVFEPEILSQEQHESMVASDDCEEYVYSKNYSAEVVNGSEYAALSTQTKVSGFTTYGEQLAGLRYQFDDSTVKKYYNKQIAVGTAMKKLYDSVKADIQKGTSSAVFNDNATELKKLGVTITVPSYTALGLSNSETDQSKYKQVLQDMAVELGWVVYRCLDMDCPEMFYSNGYCSMGYNISGTRMTIYILPMYRAGFTSLSARKQLKTQLDAKVAEIVAGAAQYSKAYDKMKYFEEWLCSHNTYNEAAVATYYNEKGEYDQFYYSANISGAPWSSVSAILNSSNSSIKGPVCEGYSRAFQLLCSKVGIQVTEAVSDSGNHMWNNVRYGNYWTGVDVTWNDSYGTKQYFCSIINNISGHILDDHDFQDWLVYPSLTAIANSSILPYYDVSATFWGRSYIQNVYDKGYMAGTSCVAFAPNTKITREQFAQLLYNIAGNPEVEYTKRFTDVSAGKWYTNAVIWAAEEGLVSGYPNGAFGVGDPISRQDITVILYHDADMPEIEDVDLTAKFTDADRISAYAYESMSWAVAAGILSGNANGTLNPRGNTTRAEAATIISKIA